MGVLHPFMLNSRAALMSMPISSACMLGIACLVVLVGFMRRLARGRALPAILLCAASVCAVAFACVYDPTMRAVLFCVEQTCALGALCCSALKVLRGPNLLPLGCGIALSGFVGLAAYGLGGLLGMTGNTSNLTFVMLIGYGAFGLVGALFVAFGGRGASGVTSDDRGTSGNSDELQAEQLIGAPSAPAPTVSSRAAQIAMFAAICISGIAAAFFDGITFNPYVHDVPGIDLVADVIVIVGGCAFAVCSVRVQERLATSIYACITACLVLSILGVALVSVSMQGVGLPIGCIGASRVLMFASVLAFLLIVGQAKHVYVLVALVCCACPWPLACGISVNQLVGYSIATITPIVLVAVAFLSIVSLVLNAHSARRINIIQSTYEQELSTQQEEFSSALTEAKREASQQMRHVQREHRNELEAVRREMLNRPPIEQGDNPTALDEIFQQFELTRREREVAVLAYRGHTIPVISDELDIAPQTVNYHLHNIYAKMGVSSKNELVTYVHALMGDR